MIVSIEKLDKKATRYVLPGFVDAHVHIESSMVTPLEFSRTAICHGTIGVVSDPHEIANVLGMEGVEFMIGSASKTPLKILFGAPSCVPATPFESSGAVLDEKSITKLLNTPGIGFLSEMMNFPGVISEDAGVIKKMQLAKQRNIPIDGHAPGLTGEPLKKYVSAGISTDHECYGYKEAEEKIGFGMKILIREGSAAKNFDTLIPLLKQHPDSIMFCTDDLHPDDLMKGHINLMVKRAIASGYDLFDVLKAASYNPVKHYGLDIGMLKVGDPADFIVADDLSNLNIIATVINGKEYYKDGQVKIEGQKEEKANNFRELHVLATELKVASETNRIRVIEALEGELITREKITSPTVENKNVVADTDRDILKIVVVDRYRDSTPSVGFITGFNLQKGAIASSIAHDSHNIICIGSSDREIASVINWIAKNKGGIAIHNGKNIEGLQLEIAGIMTRSSVEYAARMYKRLSDLAIWQGCNLKAPFMTLSFMALLVIPELKISDKGLFNGNTFSYTSVHV